MELFSGFVLSHGRWNRAAWNGVLFRSRLMATPLFASSISILLLDVITLFPPSRRPITSKKTVPNQMELESMISHHDVHFSLHNLAILCHMLKHFFFFLTLNYFEISPSMYTSLWNLCTANSKYLAEIIKLIAQCASLTNRDYIILAFEEKLWQVIVCGYYWLQHHKSQAKLKIL